MQNEIEIDVRDMLRYLLNRWMNIVIVVLTAMVIAFGATALFVTPVYESQSMIYITTNGADSSVVQNMLSSLQAGNALTADYKTLAISKPVLEQVIDDLDLDMTYAELKGNVSTENPENTRILTLKVRDKDPALAKKIVDKLTTIERNKIADIMGMNKPNVMQWGDVSQTPVSSSPKKNAAICGLIALVITLGVFIVRFIQNDKVITADDIEKTLDIRNLAEIPMIHGLNKETGSTKKSFKKIMKEVKKTFRKGRRHE